MQYWGQRPIEGEKKGTGRGCSISLGSEAEK